MSDLFQRAGDFQRKTPFPGGTPVAVPTVRAGHRNHIHASGQR